MDKNHGYVIGTIIQKKAYLTLNYKADYKDLIKISKKITSILMSSSQAERKPGPLFLHHDL